MGTQLARFRIDNRELLFNTQSKRVFFRAHGGSASPKAMVIGGGANVPQKRWPVIPSRAPVANAPPSLGSVSILPEVRSLRERVSEALCRSYAHFWVPYERR
jgi:hypothetical protein